MGSIQAHDQQDNTAIHHTRNKAWRIEEGHTNVRKQYV